MPRPVRPWFRFYVETFGDRKIRRLPAAQRWLWAGILGAARESCEPGALFIAPNLPMSVQELADYAGVSLREVRAGLEAMAKMSMVTDQDGLIRVTNWHGRQFESDDVTQRTRDHRERSEERGRNVPGNAPEAETETETEETHTSAPADAEFDRFWDAYPRKVAKGQARRAWKTARKKAEADVLVDAAMFHALATASIDRQYVKHPASWLNGECWGDEAAASPANGTRRLPHVDELERPPDGLTDEQYAAWDLEQRERRRQA